MRIFQVVMATAALCGALWGGAEGSAKGAPADGWVALFDGKTLDGWRASENNAIEANGGIPTFTVADGCIKVKGARSHLFYTGPVAGARFKNFEWKADILTKKGANSGMYFHTAYQEKGWPSAGYEVQVNQTHGDRRKTGGLYGVSDVMDVSPAKDDEWFTQHVIVWDKLVVVKVNDKVTTRYVEPEGVGGQAGFKGRRLSSGTLALQGHDPQSEVYFKNVMVRLQPDTDAVPWQAIFDGKTLDGWEVLNGTATYRVEDGAIVGTTVEGSPNSFLCTKKHYADFDLEFEVQLDPRLNSGVQVRSNSLKEYQNGRVHGYQVEIAANGSSGYIYDEARRGWLSKDRSDPAARAAFKNDGWNRFKVVCIGDMMLTWVNGVPVASVVDGMTPRGFIGLQVHSFKGDAPAWVKWRAIRLREIKTP